MNHNLLVFSLNAFTEGHLAHLGNSRHGYISYEGALISLVMRSHEDALRTVSQVQGKKE